MDARNSAAGIPEVSVVMPCYNSATFLAMSIGSVQAQTHHDWELIVVDDGSRDSSWETLQQMAAADPRIRPIRQSNAGAAAARNRGLRETRGTYIAFLDADDTWHPEFLAALTEALRHAPQAGLAYCGWQNLGLPGGRGEPFVPPEYEDSHKVETLLGGCRWPIHGALTRASEIRAHGGFDESLSSCMDYDLWLRLGAGTPLVRVPRVLAYYHHHEGERITRDRARIAFNHWRAQRKFLDSNADVAQRLGQRRIRDLTIGELQHRGFDSYWKRDLGAARRIFREVMAQGYGSPRDWLYMLPALLPERLHRFLLGFLDRARH